MRKDRFAYSKLSVEKICTHFGVSRQAYYKSLQRDFDRLADRQTILNLIKERRVFLPREGGRKLHRYLTPLLQQAGIQLGRDRLFDLLRAEQMLVRPKRRYTITTNSAHRFRVYPNITPELDLTGPHQLYVSDITYIQTRTGFMYLCLTTDAWSRKIVGYDISDSLEMVGCLRALKMAINQLPANHQLIHHSDRGSQYCSAAYTALLKKNNIRISMADKGNCYQNALAERVNGILKDEFYLDHNFAAKPLAAKATNQAIALYNQLRMHTNIDWLTPEQKHSSKPGYQQKQRLMSLPLTTPSFNYNNMV